MAETLSENLSELTMWPNLTFNEGRKYSVLVNFCFADFVAYYELDTKPKVELENDNQPEVLPTFHSTYDFKGENEMLKPMRTIYSCFIHSKKN